jgi:hypothetical protein
MMRQKKEKPAEESGAAKGVHFIGGLFQCLAEMSLISYMRALISARPES